MFCFRRVFPKSLLEPEATSTRHQAKQQPHNACCLCLLSAVVVALLCLPPIKHTAFHTAFLTAFHTAFQTQTKRPYKPKQDVDQDVFLRNSLCCSTRCSRCCSTRCRSTRCCSTRCLSTRCCSTFSTLGSGTCPIRGLGLGPGPGADKDTEEAPEVERKERQQKG